MVKLKKRVSRFLIKGKQMERDGAFAKCLAQPHIGSI